ncbi:MAG: hypothetical protein WA705_09695 [Candidatus Ozemobacteraceae bacterium]
MKRNFRLRLSLGILVSFASLVFLVGIAWAGDDGDRNILASPDEKYNAEPIGSFPQIDYQIIKSDTGESVFRTDSLNSGVNDVKTGCFSPDSRYFAAVYFYGHKGTFTWTGIWDVKTGRKIREKTCKGYVRDTSWIFEQEEYLPAEVSRVEYDNCPIDGKAVKPAITFLYYPESVEGQQPDVGKLLSFCCEFCRNKFQENPARFVGIIKKMPHEEHPLDITNVRSLCPVCHKPAVDAYYRINSETVTFFCSPECARTTH